MMGEKELAARAQEIAEQMHPKMRDRIVTEHGKRHLREFVQKLAEEGRAEYDSEGDRTRMLGGEEFPMKEFGGFYRARMREEG